MIRLAGRRPDIDIKIEYVGLRPGEKLFEELLHTREQLVPSQSKGLLLAAPRTIELAALKNDIAALEVAAQGGDVEGALKLLRRIVPEYQGEEEPLPLFAETAARVAE
jgi:O-antigen biosynthesis protein WbqV